MRRKADSSNNILSRRLQNSELIVLTETELSSTDMHYTTTAKAKEGLDKIFNPDKLSPCHTQKTRILYMHIHNATDLNYPFTTNNNALKAKELHT